MNHDLEFKPNDKTFSSIVQQRETKTYRERREEKELKATRER